jgi:hypothetical protein
MLVLNDPLTAQQHRRGRLSRTGRRAVRNSFEGCCELDGWIDRRSERAAAGQRGAMTATPTPPGAGRVLLYSEDRAGLNALLVAQAATATVLFAVACTLDPFMRRSFAVAALLAVGIATAGVWGVSSLTVLRFTWPVGIRVDSAGIRIGGLRARERRQQAGRWPPRKPFHVSTQGRAVFTCPWEGVQALYLVRRRAELKPLMQQYRAFRKQFQQLRRPLGMLNTNRAALVIVNSPALAYSEPGMFRGEWARPGTATGVPSPTWLVPTRHPEALLAALARAPAAPPVRDHLPPGERFRFFAGIGPRRAE